jgi:hypothetical protein
VDEENPTTRQYLMADGSPAYDERSADHVRIWDYDDVVVILTRHESVGWVEGERDEVGPQTELWRDADAWLEHHAIDGQVS